MRKLTQNQIVEKMMSIHGDEYDYSSVPLDITSKDRIPVICGTHGLFYPSYHDHVYHKSKCPECSRLSKSNSREKFITEAIKVHGDKYDYSLVEYKNNYTKVVIICPNHGEFTQVPYSHVDYKNGCKKCCNEKQSIGRHTFIERATKLHDNLYGYDGVQYKNVKTEVTLTCPKHGNFEVTPENHLYRKSGCPACADHVMYNERYLLKHSLCPGTLYLIKLKGGGEEFVKIGITKHHHVARRFEQQGLANYTFEVIGTMRLTLLDAFKREQQILQQFNEYSYTPKQKFSGRTECFRVTGNVVQSIVEMMEN